MKIINMVFAISLGLAFLFLLSTTIILPYFNDSYNYVVTGLSQTTTRGIFLIVLLAGLVSFILYMLPKFSK